MLSSPCHLRCVILDPRWLHCLAPRIKNECTTRRSFASHLSSYCIRCRALTKQLVRTIFSMSVFLCGRYKIRQRFLGTEIDLRHFILQTRPHHHMIIVTKATVQYRGMIGTCPCEPRYERKIMHLHKTVSWPPSTIALMIRGLLRTSFPQSIGMILQLRTARPAFITETLLPLESHIHRQISGQPCHA